MVYHGLSSDNLVYIYCYLGAISIRLLILNNVSTLWNFIMGLAFSEVAQDTQYAISVNIQIHTSLTHMYLCGELMHRIYYEFGIRKLSIFKDILMTEWYIYFIPPRAMSAKNVNRKYYVGISFVTFWQNF